MTRLADVIDSQIRRQIYRRRQVRAGRFVKPYGLRRGLVNVGACGQVITGDRLADIAPDDPVIVASDGNRHAILSAPATKPGPAASRTKKLGGSVYTTPPYLVEYLVLVADGPDLEYRGITADGIDAGQIGSSIAATGAGRCIVPDAGEGLGEGTRIAEIGGALFCFDFINGNTFSYTPPAPWIAAAPQKMDDGGGKYWWIEWQVGSATTSTPVRLMSSATAKFTSPTAFTTGSVTFGSAVDWPSVRGPEFTFSTDFGEAGLYIERNDGQPFWLRFRIRFNGDPVEQASSAIETDVIFANVRAGYPLTGNVSLNTPSTDVLPSESEARALYDWSGQEDSEPIPTNVSGGQNVIDICPDPELSGVWFLLDGALEHRIGAGTLLTRVEFESPLVGAVGMAVLTTPIEVPRVLGG